MWTFLKRVNLIRYLIVLRVNRGLARLPACFAPELSLVLGAAIANRLPSREAQPWQKALRAWNDYGGPALVTSRKKTEAAPDAAWPIEAVLFVYPGKRNYGEGEPIVWELKLLGESADHGLFLEIILPALEEAGFAADVPWHGPTTLWGRYNLHAVYAARGPRWEPVVMDGKLDLRYRATAAQWAEGLAFEPTSTLAAASAAAPTRLTWITPFDLQLASVDTPQRLADHRQKTISDARPPASLPPNEVPSLEEILEALLFRIGQLLPGKSPSLAAGWEALDADGQADLTDALDQASHVSLLHYTLDPAPKEWPGRWLGAQVFSSIPLAVIPYLQLASLLHIGRQTHFGCGAFRLSGV